MLNTLSVEYADLAVIDLSKAQTPEGRAALAKQARNAMRDQGFFYAINHGLSHEEVRIVPLPMWKSLK